MAMTEAHEREARRWVPRVARAGYALKGLTYELIALLAGLTALGWNGRLGRDVGVIRSVMRKPFGTPMVAAIGAGLLLFGLWQTFRAADDADRLGRSWKALVRRFGMACSALGHFVLAGYCALLVFGLFGYPAAAGEGNGPRTISARAMTIPVLGRIGLIGTGVGVLIFGGYQLYRAARAKLGDELDLSPLSPPLRRAAVLVSRIGLAGRGIVFGMVGWFLLRAGWTRDADHAGGIESALKTLGRQYWGGPLLGGVAVMLAAFGAYLLILARYRRIDPAPARHGV